MSFAVDLANVANRIGQGLEKTRQAVVLELFGSVIEGTPVDTGRARGNWQTSINTPKDSAIGRLDPSGRAAGAELESNLGQLGDTVYMANNLPYAERLEEGYSRQAPAGMVRTNFARVEQILKDKAR
jgi:hypothetical protein